MTLIVMLLASGPGQPEGDLTDRLELHVSLTTQAGIDEIAHAQDPLPWTTMRVFPDGRVTTGDVIRLDTGGWAIRRTGSEDDPVWPFEPTLMRPGEYVTLHSPEGESLVYRIVSVDQEDRV